MTNSAVPAPKAREAAQDTLIHGIENAFRRSERWGENAPFGLNVLLVSLIHQLLHGTHCDAKTHVPDCPNSTRLAAESFFYYALAQVDAFKPSPEERRTILGKLLEWVGAEIAQSHYAALSARQSPHH